MFAGPSVVVGHVLRACPQRLACEGQPGVDVVDTYQAAFLQSGGRMKLKKRKTEESPLLRFLSFLRPSLLQISDAVEESRSHMALVSGK